MVNHWTQFRFQPIDFFPYLPYNQDIQKKVAIPVRIATFLYPFGSALRNTHSQIQGSLV